MKNHLTESQRERLPRGGTNGAVGAPPSPAETPRSDALWEVWKNATNEVTKYAAMYLLARDLERELQAATRELKDLRRQMRNLRGMV